MGIPRVPREGIGPRLAFCLVALLLAIGPPLTLTSYRILYAHGGGDGDPFHDDDDNDDDDNGGNGGGGGGGPPCLSGDPVNSPGCWRHRSDAELSPLLSGGPHAFTLPRVCGEVVETPAEARSILSGGGSSPCVKFRRDALTSILNIRRSLSSGDGQLGADGVKCLGVAPFAIVLRCGSFFVPDTSTADPTDAVTVDENTPVSTLVSLANQLCEMASCPDTNQETCGKTINSIASVLNAFNASTLRHGECGQCSGDETPPTITCPPGILEFECTGPDGAPIDYAASASDNCDAAPDLECFPPPGTVLPTGSLRTVECRATDSAGNHASCEFQVRITDKTPPSITCPDSPIVVDCVTGTSNGATVNYPPPSVNDLCDPDVDVVCDPPSGSFFPLGATTVHCTARDSSGNEARCQFDVIVVEDSTPSLICPADITVECTGPEGAVVEYPPPMLTATCNPPPAPSCNPPSGSLFPIGTTMVTCRTATSGGATIQCSFNVTVRDTRPPRIECPPDITLECEDGSATVNYEVLVEDGCDSSPTLVCTPPPGSEFPLGETLVTCTATDDTGNSSGCSFTVKVVDTRPPTIACPEGPVRTACLTGGPNPGAFVNYTDPVVLDGCDPDPRITCIPPSGSFFPRGTSTVVCTARDAAGNEARCEFRVEVVDGAPPSLVCVEDFSVECEGPDGAIVTYSPPVVADDCDPQPVVTCVPPPGSLFPFGTTLVTCTARDGDGNQMSCSFNVTVEDTMPPELVCPPDKVVECETTEGTMVHYEVPVLDRCDPMPAIECHPPSGSFFEPGLTVVDCVATDAHGNRSVCTFTVSVVDTRPPLIECPADITAECETPAGATVSYTANAIDACGSPVDLECVPPPGSVFPLGVTNVVCTAIDESGNRAECLFRVTVVDRTPPSITCPEQVVTECTGGGSASAAYPPPVVLDNCDPNPQVTCDPPPDTVLSLGIHLVTCIARDESGNEARCTFQIRVVDTAPPSLNCGNDIVRECEGPDGAVVTYQEPTPTDTCDAAPLLSCLPASGSLFPIGVTTVICTADDQDGNMVQCTFRVTVVDTHPPVITCPADIVIPCASEGGAQASYTATAVDTCDPTPIVTCDPPSGHVFPSGRTTVTCTARDSSGNESRCTFQVTVRDESPPEITCPEGFETPCLENGRAIVTYPAPLVSDECDPAPEVICTPPSGTALPPGAHVIECTATDGSGNESRCEFTVVVVDDAPPALVCPPDMTVECEGPDGTRVDYATPMANDACDDQPSVVCTPPSGSSFPLGQTEVVCRSKDADGNETQCTFTITVVDRTPPEIECPGPIVVDAQSEQGAVVDYTTTVTDLCDPNPQVICEPPPGSLFPIGQTTVTCHAVAGDGDGRGGASECSFTITVIDRTPPQITCPLSLIVEGTTSGTNPHKPPGWPPGHNPPANAITAIVTYPDPVVIDDQQTEPPQISCTPPSGTRLGFGTHVITCEARDRSGNVISCTFEVNVVLGLRARAFIRADANSDSLIDIGDPIWTVNHLFLGGFPPKCMDAADSNDDSDLNISDVVYTLNYLFLAGPRPPAPFYPLCGIELTDDDGIDCDRYPPCE